MDLNNRQHTEGPPSKKIRLSSPDPGDIADWNLVSQFNSELPEELGNLSTSTTLNGLSLAQSNQDATASQFFEHLSTGLPLVSLPVQQSSVASLSPQPSVVSSVTTIISSGGIQMRQFPQITGQLPQGTLFTSSTPNLGGVVMNLNNSAGNALVSSLGNIVSIQRPRSNVMAVVTNNRPAGTLALSQNGSVMLAPNTSVSNTLLRSVLPGRSLPLNRMILNVNSDQQQTVTLQPSSVTQFPSLVGIQRKVPAAASSASFTLTGTIPVSTAPQLGLLARGNGVPAQPLAPLQVPPGQPSNVTNTVGSRQVRAQTSTESEKCRMIQQQLVLLLHAHKCQRREQENGLTAAQLMQCHVPHCQTMKDVLKHMGDCTLGKACKVPHCASSRQIITHWKNCSRNDCTVCRPIKGPQDSKRALNSRPAPPTTNRTIPSNSATDVQSLDLARACAALDVSPPSASSLQQQQQLPMQQELLAATLASGSATLNVVPTAGSTALGNAYYLAITDAGANVGPTKGTAELMAGLNSYVLGAGERVSDMGDGVGIGFGTVTAAPNQEKSWHESVTPDLRNHLVYKLVQAIFPTPDPNALRDKRISSLVQYARKVEADMYETATSKEQYYLFLAEKIYKIQKELEEKRQKRIQEKIDTNVVGGASAATATVSGQDQASVVALTSVNPAALRPQTPRFNLPAGFRLPLANHILNGPSAGASSVFQSDTVASSGPFAAGVALSTAGILSQLSGSIFASTSSSSGVEKAQQNFQEALAKQMLQLEQKQSYGSLNSAVTQSSVESSRATPFQILQKQLMSSIAQQQQQQKTGATLPASQLTRTAPAVAATTLSMVADQAQGVPSSGALSMKFDTGMSLLQQSLVPEMRDIKMEVKTEVETSAEIKCEANERQNDLEPMRMEGVEETTSGGQLDSSFDGTKTEADVTPPATVNPVNKKCWKLNELRQYLMPVLENLYRMEPESIPFRQPVDPVVLQIPDYFTIIKKPMDLSTIKRKLDTGQYAEPWQFVDDVWLMFENAWLYNRKSSKVHKFCTKLSEAFEADIDSVMKSLGFCCGRKYIFCPQVLCCYGKPMCTIPVSAPYFSYQNRYVYCEKCFSEIHGDEVELVDDPTQPVTRIKKDLFTKFTNNDLEPEHEKGKVRRMTLKRTVPHREWRVFNSSTELLRTRPVYCKFVLCAHCGRKQHTICCLYMEQILSADFVCDACCQMNNIPKRTVGKYTAKKLPSTKMGSYLENRVNSFLKKKDAGAGEVTIRVLSSSEKSVEVKPGMKARYCDSGEMAASFPYQAKAIFAFEEIDGVDVCFFGMHVQEYGSNSPAPNSRRVYLAYLDSVNFFQPKVFRTAVYHEILIGYLDYVKSIGYVTAHIWACPPGEGDDYIFHCHPVEMKIPKAKRLMEWYKKMLDKAIIERVVIDYKDPLRDAKEGNIQDVTQIPYFEGDFWPNVLEENIKELEQEEQDKRRREEVEATAGQDSEELKPEGEEVAEVSQTGKKKGQKGVSSKKKNTKNKASAQRKTGKKCSQLYPGNDLVQKLFITMEKHREVFFVVRLHSSQAAAALPPINDPDPLVVNDLMDGRDSFLMIAREKHYEFSSLRRAKFSTMAMLYELHNQGRDNFVYTCNNCRANIETHYHCNTCDDFDLCITCYKKDEHPHAMERRGLDLDDGNAEADSSTQLNPVESRRQSIQRCIQSLCHASQCRDANCHTQSCHKMKRVMQHTRTCRRKVNSGCTICKQLIALCCYHAKSCTEQKCPIPFCLQIRQKLQQQRLQQRIQQQQMMRRRMAAMSAPMPEHRVVTAPFSSSSSQASPASVAKPPTDSGPSRGKDKPVSSSALLAAQQVELIARRQADAGAFPTKSDQVLAQGAFVAAKPSSRIPDGTGSEQADGWKNLLSPLASVAALHSAEEPVAVATASTSMGAPQQQQQPGTVPQNVLQQRLMLQKLFAVLRSPATDPAQQQNILKMLKSNPRLMAAFLKQMQATQNLKRMELGTAAGGGAGASSGAGANSQQASTTAVLPGLAETNVASGLALAQQSQDVLTTTQATLQILPGQQETLGLGQAQQGLIGLVGQAQQRTQGMSSLQQGLAVTNGNKVNISLNDQVRINLLQQQQMQQQPFPQQQQQHLIQQFSLHQLQQLQLHRTSAAGAPAAAGQTAVACTIQSPRLRMNANLIRTPQQTTAASNPAASQQQQQPVVMVTLTQAGHPRLAGVNSYQLQQNVTGSAVPSVGQNLAVLHGLPSPQMTATQQQLQQQQGTNVVAPPAARQSPMPRHFVTNQAATHQFPTLTIHPQNGGGLTSADRPGSTDHVMLSQLPSTYQMNNDGSITPLTPQDQLSRYVEQL